MTNVAARPPEGGPTEAGGLFGLESAIDRYPTRHECQTAQQKPEKKADSDIEIRLTSLLDIPLPTIQTHIFPFSLGEKKKKSFFNSLFLQFQLK